MKEEILNYDMTHEIVIKSHNNVCSAVGIDMSGSRFACGSTDSVVMLYDFNHMTKALRRSIRIETHTGHIVKTISFSSNSGFILICDSSPQAKIYDRNGFVHGEFMRGDMYIRDIKNTNGHTAGLVAGYWHPLDSNTCLTGSKDGSLRLWDTTKLHQKTVIKPKSSSLSRSEVTACCYNTDGHLLAASIDNGLSQIWDSRTKLTNVAAVCTVPPPPHQMITRPNWTFISSSKSSTKLNCPQNGCVTGIVFSNDGITFATRSSPDALTIWDLRNVRQPIKTFNGLPNNYSNTNVILSPDDNFFVTGTSRASFSKDKNGSICLINKKSLEVVSNFGVGGSVIQLLWHNKINQIIATGGSQNGGYTKLLFDTKFSKKGGIICLNKTSEKIYDEWKGPLNVITPFSSNEVRNLASKKAYLELSLAKTRKSKKPDPGCSSLKPGQGGYIGTSQSSLLTQHLLKKYRGGHIGIELHQDPREAFLSRDNEIPSNPIFTSVYKNTNT